MGAVLFVGVIIALAVSIIPIVLIIEIYQWVRNELRISYPLPKAIFWGVLVGIIVTYLTVKPAGGEAGIGAIVLSPFIFGGSVLAGVLIGIFYKVRNKPLLTILYGKLSFTFRMFIFVIVVTLSFLIRLLVLMWSGVVVDYKTGRPVEGVVIIRSWHRASIVDSSLEGFKETLSSKNGRFLLMGRTFSFSVPLLSGIVENESIVYKPGYKILNLEHKPSRVRFEKIPTLLKIRKEEVDKAYGNYEANVHRIRTKALMDLVRKEHEFIESPKPIKWSKIYYLKRLHPTPKKRHRFRRKTAEVRKKISDPKLLKPLIHALKDEDLNVRRRAAASLGKIEINDPSSLNALNRIIEDHIEAWADKEKDVKILANLGQPAVPPLIAALNHKSREVRWKAALALRQIQDPRAAGPLINALQDKDAYVREKVAWSFTTINDLRAVEPLINSLQDEAPGVRRAASIALGKIGGDRAIEALINTLRDEDDTVREHARQALMTIGKPAVEHLTIILSDNDWQVRRSSATILAYIRDDRALEALIAVSKDKEVRVRRTVVFALGELRDPGAVEALIVALEDEDSEVRSKAAHALGIIADPRTTEPLLNILKDPNWRVRRSAVEALAMTKDKEAIEALIEMWNDRERDVRIRAAEILVWIGSPAVGPLLVSLGHEDSYIRWRTAWALGRIKDPRAVDHLIPLLDDSVSEVKWTAAGALGELRDPRAIEPLISTMKDDDVGMKRKIAQSLTKLTGKNFGERALQWQMWWEQNKKKSYPRQS